MMNEVFQADKELIYITGKPVFLNGVPICSITINDIAEMGYSNYRYLLSYICASIDDIVKDNDDKYDNSHVYAFLLYGYLNDIEKHKGDKSYETAFVRAIKMICHTNNVSYDAQNEAFRIDDGVLNNDNFLDFQMIVKERNGISQLNEDIDNPANAKAAALLAKKKALKKKVDKAKNQDSDGITLADLISITASGLQLPISVVSQYDMYQFNDQFNRLRIFKDYDVNVQALLAGADSNSIKLQHWISKVGESDE